MIHSSQIIPQTKSLIKWIVLLAVTSTGILFSGEWPEFLTAYQGPSPVLDGKITEGEYEGATTFDHSKKWASQFAQPRNKSDLSLQGWVAHDGEYLYFAFDVTDDRVSPANANKQSKTNEGHAADGIELMINASNEWSQRDGEAAKGNATNWQLSCELLPDGKTRIGVSDFLHAGKALPEWVRNRRHSNMKKLLREWTQKGFMDAVARKKNSSRENGYVIEWKIKFDPCLKLEENKRVNRYYQVKEDRYWQPDNDRITVGLNVAIRDVDPVSDTAPAKVERLKWWAGEPDKAFWPKQWGSLQLNPGKTPIKFFVSPNGDDTNSGSKPYPFRTIRRAQEAVRLKNRDMDRDIIVYLRGGDYPITQPILFTHKDSANNGHRIFYKSYPSETANITGGARINGWKKADHTHLKNLWVASIPEVEATRQFYVNGKKAVLARGLYTEPGLWETDRPHMKFHNIIERGRFHQQDDNLVPVYSGYKATGPFMQMINWKNPEDLIFIYEVGWTHVILPVKSVRNAPDEDALIIDMQMPGFRDAQVKNGVQIQDPTYVENAFELLDEPGEWYHNRKTGKLYYYPRKNEDMRSADSILPVAEQLLRVEGTLDDPVKNISFEGLNFEYTTFLRPDTLGHAEIQANFIKNPEIDTPHMSEMKTPGSIILHAAHHINFEKCAFRKFGAGGIDFERGSQHNLLKASLLEDIAATAIQVGGVQVKDAHPEDPRAIVKNNTISNNYIRRSVT